MTPAQKTELLEAAKAHFAADMLIKGTYAADAEEFKGCSVGCFAHSALPHETAEDISARSNLHEVVANHFGYPVWLAYLQDTIFEGLPNGESAKWHVQLAETISALPDELDWQLALHRVHAAILRITYRTAGTAQEAVKGVLDLHERAGRGEDVSHEFWSAAESAARSAAESAAESAARSAARSAAESAAESAARSAAESAAESAARFAPWSAVWSAARFAPWSAVHQEIRDAVLAALPEPVAA